MIWAERIAWIEWGEDHHPKEIHEEPAEGRSLLCDPGAYGNYQWLTTQLVEIIKQSPKRLLFKTKNSTYLLTDRSVK